MSRKYRFYNYKDTFARIANPRERGRPTVIVEAGFISNSNDLVIIRNQTEDIAKEIARGIFNYLEL